MVDLIWMMNQLVDEEGNILVEGLMDSVAPVTPEETAKYQDIGRSSLLLISVCLVFKMLGYRTICF
jgi:hypothetical protein